MYIYDNIKTSWHKYVREDSIVYCDDMIVT